MSRVHFALLAAAFAGLASCVSPRVVVKPGYDFTRIHSIAVVEQYVEDRQAITDEVVRQLIPRGYKVTVVPSDESPGKADALLQVNVSQYLADKKYMVQLNQGESRGRGRHRRGRDVIVMNPATEVPGTVHPAMGVPGVDDAQILASNSTVALSFRLLDVSTREIVWSSAARYEGLDLASAVEGAVDSIVKNFPSLVKPQ